MPLIFDIRTDIQERELDAIHMYGTYIGQKQNVDWNTHLSISLHLRKTLFGLQKGID